LILLTDAGGCGIPGGMVDRSTIAKTYRDNAARCRRLAQQTTDRQIAERLLQLAAEFEERAEQAERDETED
jgi:hypothetical protein